MQRTVAKDPEPNILIMENSHFNQVLGSFPVLEKIPTLLQKPVLLLTGLSCVAGVITGHMQEDKTTMLHIMFSDSENTNYRKALDCFKSNDIKPVFINVNPENRFIKIKLIETSSNIKK